MRQMRDPFIGVSQVCAGGSCLGQLQAQLGVVFTAKLFGLQAVELLMPIITRKLKSGKLKKLQKNVTKGIRKGYENTAKAVVPKKLQYEFGVDENTLQMREDDKAHQQELAKSKLEFEKAAKLSTVEADPAEVESFLKPYDSTFADFNEMAVQYGYVALFAPAYPLAPILSMINNIIEIRVDAMRLCYACQRPTWTQAADIGSWYTVLNILGYAAVLTNATMMASARGSACSASSAWSRSSPTP